LFKKKKEASAASGGDAWNESSSETKTRNREAGTRKERKKWRRAFHGNGKNRDRHSAFRSVARRRVNGRISTGTATARLYPATGRGRRKEADGRKNLETPGFRARFELA
jgi:hypothetical protein